MRALVLLLLVAVVQKSLCDDERNLTLVIMDIFGPLAKSDNAGSSDNEASSDEVEEYITPCGFIKDGNVATRQLIEKRITIDSYKAKYTEYPWMVALFRRRTDIAICTSKEKHCWRYAAGGSLINMNVVLTAAHSVSDVRINKLKVRAGDWDLTSKEELFPYQERLVVKIILHSLHKDSNYANEIEYDAALLVVATPFIEEDNVATICLPQHDLVFSANCITAGWGKKKHGVAMNENILKVVKLDPMDREQCQIALSKAVDLEVTVHESFMCAGGIADRDSCQGDGGSPLMCVKNDYYYQRGIVSWGIGCGEEGVPGVYTDVAKIRRWIDDQMKLNGFDLRTYTYVPDKHR